MDRRYLQTVVISTALVLAAFLLTASATAAEPEYAITYTITVGDDGSADWQVEYRAPLSSGADTAAFEEYTAAIDTTYLPRFRELMERSASQAAIATSRPMAVSGFAGTSDIQTSPTGKYGVILYSFTWDGFAQPGNGMVIGDAFVGGMYLSRDTTLVIRYPSGYSVKSVDPTTDLTRDDLTWYGPRSFGAGEPRVVLEQGAFSPLLIGGLIAVLVLIGTGVGMIVLKTRRRSADLSEPAAPPLSEAEIVSLEERIVQLLRANSGEMYQSDIVKNLGLPKSTVSNALNDLHAKKLILKVKKGRENLIRLAI